MDKITVSTQLLNAILGYLGNKPYQEVYQLVEAIQKEAQAQQRTPNETAEPVPAAAGSTM
jgi:hypothetical protein